MNIFDVGSDVNSLSPDEEGLLASFTGRLVEIAAGRGTGSPPAAALNALRLPALAIDRDGCIAEVNEAANGIFDANIHIKNRRLIVRDPDSRKLLKQVLEQLNDPSSRSLLLEPVIVPRVDKLPVILRVFPFDAPGQEVRALLTLNALGPRPGPPAEILAKTFRLTPSEAKLACIIARGAAPSVAARELKISQETARNHLKSVFAKTDTHCQSELVALLLQVI